MARGARRGRSALGDARGIAGRSRATPDHSPYATVDGVSPGQPARTATGACFRRIVSRRAVVLQLDSASAAKVRRQDRDVQDARQHESQKKKITKYWKNLNAVTTRTIRPLSFAAAAGSLASTERGVSRRRLGRIAVGRATGRRRATPRHATPRRESNDPGRLTTRVGIRGRFGEPADRVRAERTS